MNIRGRLEKLETGRSPGVAIVWRHHGETIEQAKERWRLSHPEKNFEGPVEMTIVGWSEPQ